MHLVSLDVGNGFDLNLGLQTSYLSFLRSSFFPQDDDPSSLAAHLRSRHEIDGWVDVETEIARFSANQPARTKLKSEFKQVVQGRQIRRHGFGQLHITRSPAPEEGQPQSLLQAPRAREHRRPHPGDPPRGCMPSRAQSVRATGQSRC